jgi:hypothetical protein
VIFVTMIRLVGGYWEVFVSFFRLLFMYLAFILILTDNFLTYRRHLASLGAFITIAALALDPFFQQSVRCNSQPAGDPIR